MYLLDVLLVQLVLLRREADARRSGQEEGQEELEHAAHVNRHTTIRGTGARGGSGGGETRKNSVRRERQSRGLLVQELYAFLSQ